MLQYNTGNHVAFPIPEDSGPMQDSSIPSCTDCWQTDNLNDNGFCPHCQIRRDYKQIAKVCKMTDRYIRRNKYFKTKNQHNDTAKAHSQPVA